MASFQGVDRAALPSVNAPMYGVLYEDNSAGTTIDIVTQNVAVGWTTATAGTLQGLTADVADATADHLTVPSAGAGIYLAFYSCSIAMTTNSQAVETALYVDGSEQTGTQSNFASASSGSDRYQNVGLGILTLADAEEVSVRFKNITGTADCVIYQCQLVLYRLAVAS